jgi:hypothetical protein
MPIDKPSTVSSELPGSDQVVTDKFRVSLPSDPSTVPSNAPSNVPSLPAIDAEPLMPIFNLHHCFVSSSSSSHATTLSQSLMIDVPSKIWRPKPANRYVPLDYGDNIDDDLLVFTQCGNSVRRVPAAFESACTDVHFWDSARDTPEFTKHIRVSAHVDFATRGRIEMMVQNYWDVFYEAGVSHTVLGFEFAIDTGGSQPVCCRKPSHGPHESKIILEQQQVLLANGWIRKCYGPWGSLVVLAPKPHQEDIINVEDFIWCMCVSCRKLNSVALPFEHPIPRCEDAVDDFGDSAGKLCFISLDACSGYHQIAVRHCDQDKLAFFLPDDEKHTFSVMPFGPRNAPGFYTCMMHVLSTEWNALFKSKHPTAQHTGDRVIIDDILLCAVAMPDLLNCLECVLLVCQKHRLSLKLSKCDFLKERVEHVGHDLTSDGNCPSQSKFDMINDWPLPATGQALHSLIQLCNFYDKHCPWLEIKLKPLRQLIKLCHHKSIPPSAWTPPLSLLFDEVKLGVTSSPCLARYDRNKLTFLKTDWSADGFGSILMQPDDSPASVAATQRLVEDGVCDFDLTLKGARSRPVRFDSRKCTEQERHFHSFVGEAACGRWGISKNKKHLWGTVFYWICDCSAMKEMLNYDGQIHVVRRWAQELLGHHFAVIHRPACMMQDVDALSRRHDGLVHQCMLHAAHLSAADRARRPCAYDPDAFPLHATACLEPAIVPSAAATTLSPSLVVTAQPTVGLLLIDPMLAFADRVAFASHPASLVATLPPVVSTSRPNSLSAPASVRSFTTSTTCADSGLTAQPLANVCSAWLSIDPGVPSVALTLPTLNPLSCVLPIVMAPTAAALSLVTSLLPSPVLTFVASVAQLCAQLRSCLQASIALCGSMHQPSVLSAPAAGPVPVPSSCHFILPPVHGIDFTFPASGLAHSSNAALPWLLRVLDATQLVTSTNPLRVFVISVPCPGLTADVAALDAAVHNSCSSSDWLPHQCSIINTAAAGDLVSSIRWLAVAHRSAAPPVPSFSFSAPANPLCAAYGSLVIADHNNRDQALSALRADTLRLVPAPPFVTPNAASPKPNATSLTQQIAAPPGRSPTQPIAAPPSCSPTQPIAASSRCPIAEPATCCAA